MSGEPGERALFVVERRSRRGMGVDHRDPLDDEGGYEQDEQGTDPGAPPECERSGPFHRTREYHDLPSRVMATMVTFGETPLSVKRMTSPT